MKRGVNWFTVLGAFIIAAQAGLAGGQDTTGAMNRVGRGSDQILFNCKIVEMPSAMAEKMFGAQGPGSGGEIADDVVQFALQQRDVKLLSTPYMLTRAGASVQISMVNERTFVTSFKVNEKTGGWEPVTERRKIGDEITVLAERYPGDPDRFQGAAQMVLTRLLSVTEQQVTPPGQKDPLRLQSPVIDTRTLTAPFDVRRGKTVVLGSFDAPERTNGNRVVVVLLSVNSISPPSPVMMKAKAIVIPRLEFKDSPLSDVLDYLAQQSQQLDPQKKGLNIVSRNIHPSVRITLSMREVPLFDVIRLIANTVHVTADYEDNAIVIGMK